MAPSSATAFILTDWNRKPFREELARDLGAGLIEKLLDAVPRLGERVEPRPEHVSGDGTADPCSGKNVVC